MVLMNICTISRILLSRLSAGVLGTKFARVRQVSLGRHFWPFGDQAFPVEEEAQGSEDVLCRVARATGASIAGTDNFTILELSLVSTALTGGADFMRLLF